MMTFAPLLLVFLPLVAAGVSSRQDAEAAAHAVDSARAQLAIARQQAAVAHGAEAQKFGHEDFAECRRVMDFGDIDVAGADPLFEIVTRIEAVGIADVQRAAARVFRATPTLAAMGPAGQVPDVTRIRERLAA